MSRQIMLLLATSAISLTACEDAPISEAGAQPVENISLRRLAVTTGDDPWIANVISSDDRYALSVGPGELPGIFDFEDASFTPMNGGPDPYVPFAMLSPGRDRLLYASFETELDDFAFWVSNFSLANGIGHTADHRRLLGIPDYQLGWYRTFGWSERGEILSTIWDVQSRGTTDLVLVSDETGEHRVVATVDGAVNAAINTAGNLIAYDVPSDENADDHDIYLIADETRTTLLVAGPSNDIVLGWLPGSDDFFFLSDRSGNRALWRQPMSGEFPAEGPVLLREIIGNIDPIGLNRDAFYFRQRVDSPQVEVARLDAETGSLLPLPSPFEDVEGRMTTMAWSPDGELVVHDLDVQGESLGIVLRSAQGEVISEWTFNMRMGRRAFRWMPDGQAIVFNASDSDGREALRLLDLATGELATIKEFTDDEVNGGVGAFAVDPSGVTFAYVLQNIPLGQSEGGFSIVRRNLETGEEAVLHRTDFGGALEYSPDGRWLALQVNGEGESFADDGLAWPKLELLPADGGEPIELFTADEGTPSRIRMLGFTPDSSWLYFRLSDADESGVLWRVPILGGDPEQISGVTAPIRFHPDGETLAYWAGSRTTEYWAITGLVDTVQ